MTQMIPTSDKDLQTKVTDELSYHPGIDAAHLVVLASNGVVTLSGDVATLPERYAAKSAARRVAGVTAVTDDMAVRDPGAFGATDRDIAEAADKMLSWAVDVPADAVRAGVRDHKITLSGAVNWQYQREAAARAVMYLKGVTAVSNTISLTSTVPTADLRTVIEAAILRNAQLDTDKITVVVDGGDVTLRGSVRSWTDRRQAEYLAWSAVGVAAVQNDLVVTA